MNLWVPERQITKSTKSKINLNIDLKRQNSQAKLFFKWAKSIRDTLQGINLTAETMRTNMSPLTDLDMHDQFAKPQSNGAALLKKRRNSSIEYSIHAYRAYSAILWNKIGWKSKILKKVERQMYKCLKRRL